MKVYISSDMEGTAGVVDWSQCLRSGGEDYRRCAALLTAEVNAAITGAAGAGATEFLVNDSHSTMANLRPEELAGGARYLSGRFKPLYMMQGLDGSFDAVFFVSYHGAMDSDSSVLSHTYFPGAIRAVRLNGRSVGEGGINCLVALAHRVPVVLVTGDETTVLQTRSLCPGVRGAAVKRSVSRFAADSLHPSAACALIESEAAAAVAQLPAAALPDITLPATLEVDFTTSDYAMLAARIGGVERTGPLQARIVGDDPLAVFEAFVTVVLLCRGLLEQP